MLAALLWNWGGGRGRWGGGAVCLAGVGPWLFDLWRHCRFAALLFQVCLFRFDLGDEHLVCLYKDKLVVITSGEATTTATASTTTTLFYSRLCPSTAGSSPPPES